MKLEGFGTTANPIDSLFSPKAKAVNRGAFEGLLDQQHQATAAPAKATGVAAERAAGTGQPDREADARVDAIEPDERDVLDDDARLDTNDDQPTSADVGAVDSRAEQASKRDQRSDDDDGESSTASRVESGEAQDAGQAAADGADEEADEQAAANREREQAIAKLDQERPAIVDQPSSTPAEQVVADLRNLTQNPDASAAQAAASSGQPNQAADAGRTAATLATNQSATESADDARVVISKAGGDRASGQQADGGDAQSQEQAQQRAQQAQASGDAPKADPAQPGSGFGAAVVESAPTGNDAPSNAADGDAAARGSNTGAQAAAAKPEQAGQSPTNTATTASVPVPAAPTSTTGDTAPPAQPLATTQADLPEAEAQRLTDRVVRGLQTVVNQRGGSLTMRLTPAHLGSMRINVQVDGTTVNAQFQVSSNAAGQALQTNLAALRHSLESQGLTVEQINVQVQPSSPSSSTQANAQNHDESPADGRSRGRNDSQTGGRGDARDDSEPNRDFQRELLDFVA